MSNKLKTTLLADNFVFLEGPRWHKGELWLSDMWDHTIFRMAEDGSKTPVIKVPNRPSGLGFLPDDTLIVASMADRTIYKVLDGKLELHADLSGTVSADINDTVVDHQGRIYVGNFGYDLFSDEPEKPADLILVDTDGSHRVVAEGLQFPNGMVISQDGKHLIVAETFGHKLSRFDIAGNGDLTNRLTFADLPDYTPDGICLDVEDHIWISSFMTGDFLRIAPNGSVAEQIKVDGAAVACQLGGCDGHTLYCLVFAGEIEDITSGKRLARIETATVSAAAAGSP
ncbi:MAG: SMP-30/gluconolactonase/LRE family protein [Gammaproteobacteria bacterium]